MKNCFILRLALCVSFLVFFGCNKTSENATVAPKGDFTIENARKWYDQTQVKARTFGALSDTLIWGNGVERTINKEESIVVVPLLQRQPLAFTIQDGRKGEEKKSEDNLSMNIRRSMVFRKVREKIEYFEMRIISDRDYYSKRNKTKMDRTDFDGYVYFVEMDGHIRQGLIYENGKITGDFGGAKKRGRISTQVEICTQWYHQGCTEGYGCSGWIPQEITCETITISNSSSTGSVFTVAFDGALSSGSDMIMSSVLLIPAVLKFWNETNLVERQYFTERWWLLFKAATARKTATEITELFYCNDSDDGNWNAFKHTFWAMLLCQSVGPATTLEIAYNHEDLAIGDKRTMDLFNNDLGIKTYKKIKSSLNAIFSEPAREGYMAAEALKLIQAAQAYRLLPVNAPNAPQTLMWTNGNDRCK